MFPPYVKQNRTTKRDILFIIIIGGIVLNLILFLSLSVLGAYQTKRCRITYTQQVIFPVRRRIAANHVEIDLL